MIKYHMKLKSSDDIKKNSVRYRSTDEKEVSFYIPKDDLHAAFGSETYPDKLFIEIAKEARE